MFRICVIGTLLGVVFIAARYNWDGFRERNIKLSFSIVVASFCVAMGGAFFLAKMIVFNLNPNTPFNCLVGAVTMLSLYVHYKLGAQDPVRKRIR